MTQETHPQHGEHHPEHEHSRAAEDRINGPVPTIGRTVHYRLSEADVHSINAHRNVHGGQGVIHHGNSVNEGDEFPMTIVRVHGNSPDAYVNGQVHLDGNDQHWATSVKYGEGPGTWSWPHFKAAHHTENTGA